MESLVDCRSLVLPFEETMGIAMVDSVNELIHRSVLKWLKASNKPIRPSRWSLSA